MNVVRLVWRNLLYHWRGNLAVCLGVVLGTAVLTGALLVGDSLRGSLRELTLGRLGWIDEAVLPARFFRAALATGLPVEKSAPAILLQGSVATEGTGSPRRAAKVSVLGVDASFWPAEAVPGGAELWQSSAGEVVLNRNLAEALGVQAGDRLKLNVHKVEDIPRETLLGKRKTEDVVDALTVTVREVLDQSGLANFSLRPTPEPASNLFVPLKFLQERLDQPGRANALLLGRRTGAAGQLEVALEKGLTLDDWGVRLRSPRDRALALLHYLAGHRRDEEKLGKVRWRGRVPEELAKQAEANGNFLTREQVVKYYETNRAYFSLESRQLLLDPVAVAAARRAIGQESRTPLAEHPTLVYLADTLSDGTHEVPYVVVAGIDGRRRLPDASGQEFRGAMLQGDEIALVEWPGSPLTAKVNDRVRLVYYAPDERNHLVQKWEDFTVRQLVPLTGSADDPDLTPEFPGITDKLDMASWEDPPFPYNPRRIKAADEEYWKRYRATPRAYINLERAQRLWGSRFGQLTSLQIGPGPRLGPGAYAFSRRSLPITCAKIAGAVSWPNGLMALLNLYTPPPSVFSRGGPSPITLSGPLTAPGSPPSLVGESGKVEQEELVRRLLLELKPDSGGFGVQPLRARAQQSSSGANDFGVLFAGFSSFLILSALLLVGLLFRLNIDRRAGELGLLLATGWSQRRLRRLLLAEGMLLALAGSAVGLAGALVYAPLMLQFLQANWPGGDGLPFLRLHTEPLSFAIGFAASLAVSLLTIFWASRVLGRLSPRALLAGVTTEPVPSGGAHWPWTVWLIPGSLAGALALAGVGSLATGHEARAGSFFGSGALLLTAALAAVWQGLRRLGRDASPQPTLTALGVRNASRHLGRSLLTVGLLASATFVVVAVECFHKETGADFFNRTGGSGGFSLYGESDVPFFQDLNQPAVRASLHLTGPQMTSVRFVPCRVRSGDDTSCLNLYQPLKPRVLGIPAALVDRGGFRFGATLAQTPEEHANPWLLLNHASEDGTLPAILDATTAQWGLHIKLGEIYEIDDSEGHRVRLRIVGLLQDSLFQSEILLAEANFLRLYPRHEGFNFLLVETGPSTVVRQVQDTLQQDLAELGLVVQSTAARVRAYEAVENMYLATFQALGGLALLLGAAGLAIVLLRGVWERRSELALLRALGFRAGRLAWLVLAENLFLLVLGLAAGTLAALLAVAPHLAGSGAEVLWLRIGLLLLGVLAVGLCAGVAAVLTTVRAPVLQALRQE